MESRRQALLAALQDSHPGVRQGAAAALDRLDALEGLAEKLGRLASLDRVGWVRLLRSLDGIRDETCLKLGVRALGHREEEVRLAGLDLVGAFGDWRAVGPAARLLEDPSPVVRARAADVLGRLGDRRAGEAVARRLDDPDARVIAAAADATGRLGHTAAEGALIRLTRHSDPEVRQASLAALGRVGAGPGR